ncbi:MAG: glutathione peroxidase [Azonexus sp.]|nr:glutathione peroxidase [Azonexus sp.]MDZ4315869.1 glutathione peroxidase [Azonexus sp.]
MILNLKRWLGIAGFLSLGVVPTAAGAACPALLNHSFPGLQDGKAQSLCQYQGKVILVVNTASFCGFTSQYEGLEKLYANLKGKGLVVVGFPANDFGEQEPGSSKEIADFCRLTYGVEFPMMGKTVVKGKDANPFYQQLAQITGSSPKWNFHKYLINRDASQVLAFGSSTTPDDQALLKKIDEFLK